MLYLSKFMRIDFNEILLSTTYNKIQITSDSINVPKNGVFNKEANSLINILSDGDFKAIDEFTDKVYNRAIKNLDPL